MSTDFSKNPKRHPFYSSTYGEHHTFCCTADDRIARVKPFTQKQCKDALQLEDLQKTVVKAIERRLRQLETGGAK